MGVQLITRFFTQFFRSDDPAVREAPGWGLGFRVAKLLTETFDGHIGFESELGRKIGFGEFAENITTHGFPVHKTKPFDKFIGPNIELEVTQIGKKCHGTNCEIFQQTGNCVMPKEGIFCRVTKTGILKENEDQARMKKS